MKKKLLAIAALALMTSVGCASGRIHEKNYLRAAAVTDENEKRLAFACFEEKNVLTGTGADIDSAKNRAELIGGKPIFTGYTELVIVEGENTLELLEHMLNEWKISPSCMVVCSENGEELLSEYDAEQLIGRAEQAVKQGIAPKCDVITVLGKLCQSGSAEVAELRSDGSSGSRIIF